MSKKVINHVHKLKRFTYKTGNSIYSCILEDCFFKTDTRFALGKRTICHRCGKSFVMNQYTITLAKPHCEECHVYKNGNNAKKVSAESDKVLASVATSTIQDSVDGLKNRLNSLSVEFKTLPPDEEDLI